MRSEIRFIFQELVQFFVNRNLQFLTRGKYSSQVVHLIIFWPISLARLA